LQTKKIIQLTVEFDPQTAEHIRRNLILYNLGEGLPIFDTIDKIAHLQAALDKQQGRLQIGGKRV